MQQVMFIVDCMCTSHCMNTGRVGPDPTVSSSGSLSKRETNRAGQLTQTGGGDLGGEMALITERQTSGVGLMGVTSFEIMQTL